MLGVVLLYVGAVLAVNGIWLVGQARAAEIASRIPVMERETAAVGSTTFRGGGYAGEAARGQELGGERVTPPDRSGEAHPLFIQNREIAILNIFTGFIGVAIAVAFIVSGGLAADPAAGNASVRAGGAVLLFAFTYLWVAYNQWANAGGRGLGWYSLFVAITAVVFGVYTLTDGPENTATLWLAADWFAWAVQNSEVDSSNSRMPSSIVRAGRMCSWFHCERRLSIRKSSMSSERSASTTVTTRCSWLTNGPATIFTPCFSPMAVNLRADLEEECLGLGVAGGAHLGAVGSQDDVMHVTPPEVDVVLPSLRTC